MSIVSYKNNSIEPAPTISIERVFNISPDGTTRQRYYKIGISGNLMLFRGSPDATGAFWQTSGSPPDLPLPANWQTTANLDIFKFKIGAMQTLFDQQGGELIIQPQNGAAAIRMNLTINNITFQEGLWTQKVPYQIQAETQNIIWGTESGTDPGSQSQLTNPPEENWEIQASDDVGRVFKLTHNISSNAKKRFNSDGTILAEGWQVAQALVLGNDTLVGPGSVSKLGFDQTFLTSSGVLDQTNFRPFNYIRSDTVDKSGGRFAVSESWTCIDTTVSSPTGQTAGKAIEDLNIETKYSLDDGLFTVNLNGVVTGLEERDPITRAFITSRWDNANTRFATISPSVLFNLAQTLSATTLNPQALSTTISKNRVTGVFQYSISFNNRIANTNSGYLTESIDIEFNNAKDIFAEIGVINRPAGPILQSIGSTSSKSATISISITMPTSYDITPTMPTTNPLAIFISYVGIPNQIFLASDTPRWSYKTGRYTRTTTYVYQ